MNRRHVLTAIALLAAVIAGLVMFFLRAREDSRRTPDTPPVAAASAKATPGASARSERRVEIDDDVAGTIRLEGQVIDAEARPVAGAIVVIDTNPHRTATTEEDGSFVFEQLLGRSYELVATAGELAAGPITAQVTEHTEPVVLRMSEGGTVEITVTAAKGDAALADAAVELHGTLSRAAKADARGHVTFRGIPAGWYAVVASAPGYARATTFANVGSGASVHRLQLVAGAAVAGRVVDADGHPVARARVTYEGASDWTQAGGERSVTDEDGRFRIEAMQPGSFRFHARHADHAPGATDPVVLDGTTVREDVVIRMRRGATIAGVVVDASQTPVPYARVRAVEEAHGLYMQAPREATADARGRFRLASLPAAAIKLVALHDGATSKTERVDLATAPAAEVTLALDVVGMIAGVVVDSRGEPVDGAQVWAMQDGGGDADDAALRDDAMALTDGGGRFALRGLPAGRFELRANPPGATLDLGTALLRDAVAASVGDTAVRIVIPASGGITGKVAFDDGRVPPTYVVSLGGWDSATTIASTDGAFTLRDLPPRDYRLTIRGPGFSEKTLATITVAPGAIADAGTITVHPGRSISGRVVDASGNPVAGATVSAGPFLWGTGTKTAAPAGLGGPPGAGALKQTTTNASGEFALVGVGRGWRHVVADHDALGRSVPISLSTTERSAAAVQLALVPYGALEGKVVMAGAPASRMVVNAQSKTVPEAMFSVITGDDGSYRFDRLAPDTYSVSAMTGGDPMRGFGFHARTTTVASGKATRLELSVDAGETTLAITPLADGKPVAFAMVYGVRGTVTAATGKELERIVLRGDAGQSSFAMAIGGDAAHIDKLAPGPYTVCAQPYPAEVGDEVEDYMVREGDNLAVFCKQLTIAPRAKELPVTIAVTLPAFVPPAEDE